jgi:hypothetical protein
MLELCSIQRCKASSNMLNAGYHLMHSPATTMALPRLLLILILMTDLSGCAVVAVADAAVTVVATGVKVSAKAVGAVADAVIPGN